MRAGRGLWQTVVVLFAVNVLGGFGWLGPPVVSAPVLTAAVLTVAWQSGATGKDLGLRPEHLRAGLGYGAASVGIVAAALLLAVVLPVGHEFLNDSRADMGAGRLALEVVVSIFLLTAVPEEIAFRGVLFGFAVRRWGAGRAAVITSLLFGLWHIAPTLHTMSGNEGFDDAAGSLGPVLGPSLMVLGAVGVTFIAGLVFCWLRVRSRSLLAPILTHAGLNGCALVAAWIITH